MNEFARDAWCCACFILDRWDIDTYRRNCVLNRVPIWRIWLRLWLRWNDEWFLGDDEWRGRSLVHRANSWDSCYHWCTDAKRATGRTHNLGDIDTYLLDCQFLWHGGILHRRNTWRSRRRFSSKLEASIESLEM